MVVVYRVFKVEAAIYDAIEELKEALINRIASTEIAFEVHMAVYFRTF
ncbi:MAG: hypothetical protein KME31_01160 [Tolypothrix carrinoi HA7290-LM1]|jgi:hypothetical protein|nr:hypothetical protein [Tolypothrix carrinoi HA7290-LM1]